MYRKISRVAIAPFITIEQKKGREHPSGLFINVDSMLIMATDAE
jgi:hypothetical protein